LESPTAVFINTVTQDLNSFT